MQVSIIIISRTHNRSNRTSRRRHVSGKTDCAERRVVVASLLFQHPRLSANMLLFLTPACRFNLRSLRFAGHVCTGLLDAGSSSSLACLFLIGNDLCRCIIFHDMKFPYRYIFIVLPIEVPMLVRLRSVTSAFCL